MQTIAQIGDERQRRSNEKTRTRWQSVDDTYKFAVHRGARSIDIQYPRLRTIGMKLKWPGWGSRRHMAFKPREGRERHAIRGSVVSGSGTVGNDYWRRPWLVLDILAIWQCESAQHSCLLPRPSPHGELGGSVLSWLTSASAAYQNQVSQPRRVCSLGLDACCAWNRPWWPTLSTFPRYVATAHPGLPSPRPPTTLPGQPGSTTRARAPK